METILKTRRLYFKAGVAQCQITKKRQMEMLIDAYNYAFNYHDNKISFRSGEGLLDYPYDSEGYKYLNLALIT
ncbi:MULTISPECIES: hypothetical protein [unclassified Gilliamella]|uniref:hypothetical protein n=1 Tax=unclassified Gilliamella TaxID=2685620 RepID=UPI00130B9E3E|nr:MULTISPECIES: hypothetical protein [unclassified Gilliamella]MWP48303.1 hypothetical protein [Gilliamella sp. Lep-s35]MWP68223.1 hypothetical protein [Gilliamella sp. Lep-s5]MWP76443.1 hypothetical protein [Gilliamella sp. Lep-s21]